MEIQYATDVVSAGQRFDYWTEVVCKHFIPATSLARNRENFNAHFGVRPLGWLTVGEMRSPPHLWERNTYHLRVGPNDDFMLSLVLEGHGRLSQGGRELTQTRNGLALYNAAQPFSYDLNTQSVLLLRIPRRQLLHRVPLADQLTATPLPAAHPATVNLTALIRMAAEVDDLPAAAQDHLSTALLELLAVVLLARAGQDTPQTTHEVLFDQAKRYMAQHLTDPDLDIERVATRLGISTRTLTRVFAEHGLTPKQWLWQQRLEGSYCALREGRARQVTEAAFNHGFSDVSHYCRAFKKNYGITPSQALRMRCQ